MEPGSNLPSLADGTLLLILILFTAADLLAAVILHVYRTLLEEDIVIPGGEDKSGDRPISERLLDDEHLIDKLRTAARCLTMITSGLAGAYAICVLPYKLTTSILFLLVLGIALVLILLETIVTACFSRNPQKTADKLAVFCIFLSRIFTPLFLLIEHIIPDPDVPAHADIEEEESHLRDWVENIPENTLLEQDERKMIRSIVRRIGEGNTA